MPFKYLTDRVMERMRLRSESDTFDLLNQRLFDGTISTLESVWLWYMYTCAYFVVLLSLFMLEALTYVSIGVVPEIAVWTFENQMSHALLCSLGSHRSLYKSEEVMNLLDACRSWSYGVLRHVAGPLRLAFLVWVALVILITRLIMAGAWRITTASAMSGPVACKAVDFHSKPNKIRGDSPSSWACCYPQKL